VQGLDSTFNNSVNDQWGGGHLVYSLGLQLEIPLGTAKRRRLSADRNAARAGVIGYREQQDKVSQEVASACREVRTAFESVRTSRNAAMQLEEVLNELNRRQSSGVQAIDPNFVQPSSTPRSASAMPSATKPTN